MAALSFALNLIWEVLEMLLYTIGRTGTLPERVFAVLHCTAGARFLAAAIALRPPD